MKTNHEPERGMALAMALLVSIVIFGITGSYFMLSIGGYQNSTCELACVQVRRAAEDGLNLSIAELKSQVDPGADGIGNLVTTRPDGCTLTVTAQRTSPSLFAIHSVAVLTRARYGADVVAEIFPSQQINFAPKAAISTRGPVITTGGITIDGRDWNFAGSAVVGPGTWGILSTGSIANTGSSTVGGNGIAPSRPPQPGTQLGGYSWADGINQDGDPGIDEEAWDGVDNDNDGLIDEDTNSYPINPDVACHLPTDTLRQSAIWYGTYYTSPAQIQAAIVANGNRLPSGAVIFCDFPTWDPVDFGSTYNDQPSIFVHHNASGTATMKNVHGKFKGLMLMDTLDHLNANVILLGAVMSFAPANATNALGNGTAFIRFSSAAIANLPLVGALKVRIRSWNRAATQ
jgi:hypothetical protein